MSAGMMSHDRLQPLNVSVDRGTCMTSHDPCSNVHATHTCCSYIELQVTKAGRGGLGRRLLLIPGAHTPTWHGSIPTSPEQLNTESGVPP